MAAGDTMQGHRVTSGKLQDFENHPGAYGKVGDEWLACSPTGSLFSLNRSHEFVEHEDGTLTVSPSILVYTDDLSGTEWHGYLERGVWREV